MSATHRRSEVKELLPQLRGMAQTLIETVAASKICIAKLTLFSGVDVYDFCPDYDTATDAEKTIAEARRDETTMAIVSAGALIASLGEECPLNASVTIEQALLRIAKR